MGIVSPYDFLAVLLGLGFGVRKLAEVHPVPARHLLVWGLTAALLAGMWFHPGPWLPFIGMLLIFVNALLIPASLTVAQLRAICFMEAQN